MEQKSTRGAGRDACPPNASIRNARVEDASRILEIYAYYVENTAVTFEYVTPSLDEFSERMRTTLQKYPYLVVEEEGRIVGYAYAGPFYGRAAYDWSCELSIYLDREARGHGLGRALYKALQSALEKMGILNLYACIAYPQVADEHLTQASVRFHERLGFSRVGTFRQCGYKFNTWYDVVWME
jgi:L-amino acid N-acyltransferase YncA